MGEVAMTESHLEKLSQQPFCIRLSHKLFGHDWEVVRREHTWHPQMSKYEPRSRRTLRCEDCGVIKTEFFSEIFWKWL